MDFTTRPEVFFITYHDVIKSSAFTILCNTLTKYLDYYKNYIAVDLFKNLDKDSMLDMFINRSHYNIFKSFSIKEFDFDRAWLDIYDRDVNLFLNTPLLNFGNSLLILSNQSFVKKVVIWTEEYDERIHFDIFENYNNSNISYSVGNMKRLIEDIKPTCFVLNNIDHLKTIIEESSKSLEFANVLLADYAYNYINNEENSKDSLKIQNIYTLEEEHKFKFNLFRAIT